MPEFLQLLPPVEALARLLEHLPPKPRSEEVETSAALGRVTIFPMLAPHPLPDFPRSTVDGYALRAIDTHGASESLPAYLSVMGEVIMGVQSAFTLDANQCALIHTGGMLPNGADAVAMVETTQSVRTGEVEVLRAVAVGENVLRVGEDVNTGEEVIPAGVRLRPAEIGGLMALGITHLPVVRKPQIGIISSGDEVVPANAEVHPGQVRDVNSFTLSALVEQTGGIPVLYGIIPDRVQALHDVVRRALEECDAVVVTAGSSASVRDLTAEVIDSLGPPGVLVHGVNVRPGKPTILAVCTAKEVLPPKAVIGLPGNPVSALVIADLFLVPVIDRLLGIDRPRLRPTLQAGLKINLPSQAGREDWVPVRLTGGDGILEAEPIFGKSNLIFTLARADGLICIPADATGLHAGEVVDVFLH